MSEAKASVTVETPAAVPVIVAPAPTKCMVAWQIIEKFLLSTKLWATAIALVYLRSDYWSDVKVVYSLTQPEQLATFREISNKKSDTVKYVLMSFLGVTTAAQIMGGSVMNRYTQTTTNSFKSDPEDHK